MLRKYGGEIWWESIVEKYGRELWWESMVANKKEKV